MSQQPASPTDDTFFTAVEAVRVCLVAGLLIGESALKAAAERGEIPVTRTGGRGMRLFRASDVRRFIEARARG